MRHNVAKKWVQCTHFLATLFGGVCALRTAGREAVAQTSRQHALCKREHVDVTAADVPLRLRTQSTHSSAQTRCRCWPRSVSSHHAAGPPPEACPAQLSMFGRQRKAVHRSMKRSRARRPTLRWRPATHKRLMMPTKASFL